MVSVSVWTVRDPPEKATQTKGKSCRFYSLCEKTNFADGPWSQIFNMHGASIGTGWTQQQGHGGGFQSLPVRGRIVDYAGFAHQSNYETHSFEWSSSLSFMSPVSQSDIVFRLTKIVTGFVTPSRRAAQTENPHKKPTNHPTMWFAALCFHKCILPHFAYRCVCFCASSVSTFVFLYGFLCVLYIIVVFLFVYDVLFCLFFWSIFVSFWCVGHSENKSGSFVSFAHLFCICFLSLCLYSSFL